jgi:hypothetical protein
MFSLVNLNRAWNSSCYKYVRIISVSENSISTEHSSISINIVYLV